MVHRSSSFLNTVSKWFLKNDTTDTNKAQQTKESVSDKEDSALFPKELDTTDTFEDIRNCAYLPRNYGRPQNTSSRSTSPNAKSKSSSSERSSSSSSGWGIAHRLNINRWSFNLFGSCKKSSTIDDDDKINIFTPKEQKNK